MHCAHRDNIWKDQLTKIIEYTNLIKTKEIAYAYDANGNPTAMTDLMVSNNSKTLNWDGRQLYSITQYCQGIVFKYNDQGIRTYKSLGGCSGGYAVDYVLDGSRILAETKGSSTIYYTYDADGPLFSMNYNGNEYFYITNMQGDVVELVDIGGTTVVKYKYDAWGAIIDQYDSGLGVANANPFRYRSYYYDTETGWYYLQSRYYNPSIGRFINADGLTGKLGNSQNHNMYAYCANNPIMFVDQSGDTWKSFWISVNDWINDSIVNPVGSAAIEAVFWAVDKIDPDNDINSIQIGWTATAGAGADITLSHGVVLYRDGKSADFFSVGVGAYVGAGVSLGGGLTFSNAEAPNQTEGEAWSVGGSVMGFGYDWATASDDDYTWSTWSFSAGVGIPFDCPANYTYTFVYDVQDYRG